MAGSALKLLGVLVIVAEYPFILTVLIGSSIVRLYYYLRVFINRVVCLGSGMYNNFAGIAERGRVIIIVCRVTVLNWVGGLPLFLVCGMAIM